MALGRFNEDSPILSTVSEVLAPVEFKGNFTSEFVKANISPVLTLKSIEHSEAFTFQLEFTQQLWKIQQSAVKISISRGTSPICAIYCGGDEVSFL